MERYSYAWLILLLTRCFGTARFFLYLFNVEVSDSANEWLLDLQSFGDGSLAFVNFVVYMFTNPPVVREYWGRIRGSCGNGGASDSDQRALASSSSNVNYQSINVTMQGNS
jgi:hypothetical protein